MNKFLKIFTPFLIAITFTSCSFTKSNKVDESNKSTNTIQINKEASVKLPTIKETIDKLCSNELELKATSWLLNILRITLKI